MKLKKIFKILPPYETIRVWGNDEDTPLFYGAVEDLPARLEELKLIPGSEGAYFEVRKGCSDIEDHVAIFVKE